MQLKCLEHQVVMRWFRWNSFTVIGLALLAIGIYSLIRGAGFQFDSGLPAEVGEPWFYLLVGALMVLNGVVQPSMVTTDDPTNRAVSTSATDEPSAQSVNRPVGTNIP